MADAPTLAGTQADPSQPATPPAGSSSPTATTATGTQAEPSGNPGSDTMSLDEAKKLRAESNSLRKRVAEFEAAAKAAEDAKLSATEKLEKQYAELQQQHADYQTTAQTRLIRALVRAEAAEMGLNPQLATRLVDLSDITFDEAGDAQNLRQLLEAAAKEYGLTPSASAQSAAPKPTAGGATNPSRSSTNGGAKVPLSWDYINQLATTNPNEYLARGTEIQRWMLDNIATRPRR